MITLHHCVAARSFRPLWTLEELGLPYALQMLPFPPRMLARPYLDLNPLGTVPLLIDDDGTRMTESAAICQYLCVRHGPTPLNVEPGEADYGAYLNFLHFGEATLTFPQTLVLRYAHFESADRRLPQVAEDYSRWFLSRLKAVGAALEQQQEFLCAGRFTAADVSVGYALLLAQHLGLEPSFAEPVRRYWQRLQQRPAFRRALAAQHHAALAQGVPTTAAPDVRPAD